MKLDEPITFSSISIAFFIHSTEDEERLVRHICLAVCVDATDFSVQKLQGYFGNEIVSANAHLIGSRADEIGTRVLTSLNSASKNKLASELESHMDDHDSLYIRLDRDNLMLWNKELDRLTLGEEEAIRVKLKPRNRSASREEMVRRYRRHLIVEN